MLYAYKELEHWLTGWPSVALTLLLLVMATFLILVAIFGTPGQKAFAAIYVYLI